MLGGAEMLVIPACSSRSRRDHADGLVIDALDLVGMAVLPRGHPVPLRPCIGIALALKADEHGRGSMGMGLGISPVLVLANPEIEGIAGHEGLHAPPPRRAPVVERQIAIHHVRNEIRASHGKPAHRIGLDVVLVFVEIVRTAETLAKLMWTGA